MVGRERERATGGVLLFAEGAGCGQGCAPMTRQPRACLWASGDAPSSARWGALAAAGVHAAHHGGGHLALRRVVCSEQRVEGPLRRLQRIWSCDGQGRAAAGRHGPAQKRAAAERSTASVSPGPTQCAAHGSPE